MPGGIACSRDGNACRRVSRRQHGARHAVKLLSERRPFDDAMLRILYASRAGYMEAYEEAMLALLNAGGLLAEDMPQVRERGYALAAGLPLTALGRSDPPLGPGGWTRRTLDPCGERRSRRDSVS